MSRTRAYFIMSPTPRIGTSTLARLIADYHVAQQCEFVGFDTDSQERRFLSRFPDQVKLADLSQVQGQMVLFDNLLLRPGTPKIVDIWGRSFRTFLTLLNETRFFDEVDHFAIDPIIFFHVDETSATLDAVRDIARQWPRVSLVGVHNEGTWPLGDEQHEILARFPSRQTLEIGALDVLTRRAMEAEHFSLSRFLMAPPSNMSIVLRSQLRHWLLRIFTQLQTFELRKTLFDTDFLK